MEAESELRAPLELGGFAWPASSPGASAGRRMSWPLAGRRGVRLRQTRLGFLKARGLLREA